MTLRTLLPFLSAPLLLAAAACSDEFDGPQHSPTGTDNLLVRLNLPTRSYTQSGPWSDATQNELIVSDLWSFGYPVNSDGEQFRTDLTLRNSQGTLPTYRQEVEKGRYDVFLVGNARGRAKGVYPATSREELLACELNYDADNLPDKDIAGKGLTMVYQPSQAVDVLTPGDENATTVQADMKFTCVKFDLNILFDLEHTDADGATVTADAFGDHRLVIDGIDVSNLSSKSRLILPDGYVSGEADYLDSPLQSREGYTGTFDLTGVTGQYYEGYTRVDANKDKDNEYVITPEGDGSPLYPGAGSGKWLYRTSLYIPERYVASAAEESFITVHAHFVDKEGKDEGVNTEYTIPLGHTIAGSKFPDVRQMPRNTYYEIVADIEGRGEYDLNLWVGVKDWQEILLKTQFVHTTLWVSQADGISILPDEDDPYINYTSNVNVDFAQNAADTDSQIWDAITCAYDINDNDEKNPIKSDKPIIEVYDNQVINGTGVAYLRVNHELPISAFGTGADKLPTKGYAYISMRAGNIRKWIKVYYENGPRLEVTPTEEIITWTNNLADASTLKRDFKFITNIATPDHRLKLQYYSNTSQTWSDVTWRQDGGEWYFDHTEGASTVRVSVTGPSVNEVLGKDSGTVTVTATSDPESTSGHRFRVVPPTNAGADYSAYTREFEVTVRPALTDTYRINFRVINGKAWDNGNLPKMNVTDQMITWADGWSWNDYADNNDFHKHFIYVYTQFGETSGESIPKDKVWYFTQDYIKTPMDADLHNPGWYRYDLPVSAIGINEESGKEDASKHPSPAATLIMFACDNTGSNKRRRFPAHLQPGLPLYDYEDKEGWFVIDPTSGNGYYIYDDMPEIKYIKYTIYTKNKRIDRWHTTFNNETIWSEVSNITTENGWNRCEIVLQGIEGDEERYLTIQDGDKDPGIMLFGGQNYSQWDNTGYYDGSAWHPGKPF